MLKSDWQLGSTVSSVIWFLGRHPAKWSAVYANARTHTSSNILFKTPLKIAFKARHFITSADETTQEVASRSFRTGRLERELQMV
jgi:hypothetical protein